MAQNKGHLLLSSFFAVALALLFLMIRPLAVSAQADSLNVDSKKLNRLVLASAVGYTAGVAALNYVWYKDTERQSFRFFNDNHEWKQVDKAGHFFASFYLSDLPARALRSCRVPGPKADAVGALSGFLLTIPIEIMDGFSSGYGASVGDIVADATGPAFYLGQKALWDEVRIFPKFSFHRTRFASRNPTLLGDHLLSEVVKDYNGQTYWLSVDADRFIRFPKWLNIAVGYGAQEMVRARDSQNLAMGLRPHRQYYLGVDLDLTAVQTHSKFVKALLYVVSTVRLPAPAVIFSREGVTFEPLYF